jgi:putative hydrolase of the HAD superfamily
MPQERAPIAAVVFDLDDTLYPEGEYVRGGYRAALRLLADKLGRDHPVWTAPEPPDAWLWNRFLSFCRTGQFLPGFTGGAFDALNARYHLGLDKARIEELVAAYREHSPDIRPYDGMPETLGILRTDYCLGILSDGFLPPQRLKLEALKVERFFDAVLFTEELGRSAWKPSPEGFEVVARRLDVSHAACAYVADNPAKDFVAPNRLGWRTIQYLRPGQVHAGNPAPEGGAPQVRVHLPCELVAALRSPRT